MKRSFNRLANFLSLHCRWAKQHQFLPQRHGITWNSRCQRARWPWRWHRGAWEQLGSSHWGDVGARGKGALPTEKLDLRHHPSIWQADEGSLQGWPQHLRDSARRRRLDPWCIGEFRVFRRWGCRFLAKGAAGGGAREVPAAGTDKEDGRGTCERTPDGCVLLVPRFFLRHTTVLVPPDAIDVFGPQRSGLRCAALLGTGAGAGWRVHEQLQCSDCWSQLSRSTTESVGILWQLRLFLPGLHHCDHSHREVGDGWILVDRAGSWAAVLLHLYFRGSVVLVQLLADGYQARWVGGRAGSCQSDHRVSRQSSSRHQQMRLLMARQIRVCLGRPGHRQPQWRHQRGCGFSPMGFEAFRRSRHNSRRGKATGQLLVRSPLWGAEAVGLPLVDKVDRKHRKSAWWRRGNGGLKGKGKVQDFSTAGEEHLRREAIQAKKRHFLQSQAFSNACDEGIEGLSKDPRGDSSSQYSREVQRLFLAWLPEEERHFMEASEGLGNSPKAEVAWLERKGYAYTEVEVDISM